MLHTSILIRITYNGINVIKIITVTVIESVNRLARNYNGKGLSSVALFASQTCFDRILDAPMFNICRQ